MTETPFKDALMEYLKAGKGYATSSKETAGGYLIPPYIYKPRKGIIGYLARLIGNDYGWEKIDVYETIINKIYQESVVSKVQL